MAGVLHPTARAPVYAAFEKADETDAMAVVQRATAEVTKLARQLKVDTIVLHSFAHLFVELSSPQTALDILKGSEARLQEVGLPCTARRSAGSTRCRSRAKVTRSAGWRGRFGSGDPARLCRRSGVGQSARRMLGYFDSLRPVAMMKACTPFRAVVAAATFFAAKSCASSRE